MFAQNAKVFLELYSLNWGNKIFFWRIIKYLIKMIKKDKNLDQGEGVLLENIHPGM